MQDKEITGIIKKFERIMGPVAQTIAKETAEKMKILKEVKTGKEISPENDDEKKKYLKRLSDAYAEIIGRKVADTIIRL